MMVEANGLAGNGLELQLRALEQYRAALNASLLACVDASKPAALNQSACAPAPLDANGLRTLRPEKRRLCDARGVLSSTGKKGTETDRARAKRERTKNASVASAADANGLWNRIATLSREKRRLLGALRVEKGTETDRTAKAKFDSVSAELKKLMGLLRSLLASTPESSKTQVDQKHRQPACDVVSSLNTLSRSLNDSKEKKVENIDQHKSAPLKTGPSEASASVLLEQTPSGLAAGHMSSFKKFMKNASVASAALREKSLSTIAEMSEYEEILLSEKEALDSARGVLCEGGHRGTQLEEAIAQKLKKERKEIQQRKTLARRAAERSVSENAETKTSVASDKKRKFSTEPRGDIKKQKLSTKPAGANGTKSNGSQTAATREHEAQEPSSRVLNFFDIRYGWS